MTDLKPFQRLEDRLAGKPVDDVLMAGVPQHLAGPLNEWIERALTSRLGGQRYWRDLPRAVLVALGWSGYEGLADAQRLAMCEGDEILTVVDAILQLNEEYGNPIDAKAIGRLDSLLRHGRSAYKVADDRASLEYRVAPSALGAFRLAVSSSDETTAQLLQSAWRYAYRPNPDPTASYRESVRAVEQVAIPIVSPKNTQGTLGTVIRDLRSQSAKWELVLVDRDGAAGQIEPLVGMLDLLWQGQRSRHGGGSSSRDQSPEEAQAAVHLAVLAIQWLTSGALRRKV